MQPFIQVYDEALRQYCVVATRHIREIRLVPGSSRIFFADDQDHAIRITDQQAHDLHRYFRDETYGHHPVPNLGGQ